MPHPACLGRTKRSLVVVLRHAGKAYYDSRNNADCSTGACWESVQCSAEIPIVHAGKGVTV